MEQLFTFDELFIKVEHHFEPRKVLQDYLGLRITEPQDGSGDNAMYSYFIDLTHRGKAIITKSQREDGKYSLDDFSELREALPYYIKSQMLTVSPQAPVIAFLSKGELSYMLQFVKKVNTPSTYF